MKFTQNNKLGFKHIDNWCILSSLQKRLLNSESQCQRHLLHTKKTMAQAIAFEGIIPYSVFRLHELWHPNVKPKIKTFNY